MLVSVGLPTDTVFGVGESGEFRFSVIWIHSWPQIITYDAGRLVCPILALLIAPVLTAIGRSCFTNYNVQSIRAIGMDSTVGRWICKIGIRDSKQRSPTVGGHG